MGAATGETLTHRKIWRPGKPVTTKPKNTFRAWTASTGRQSKAAASTLSRRSSPVTEVPIRGQATLGTAGDRMPVQRRPVDFAHFSTSGHAHRGQNR